MFGAFVFWCSALCGGPELDPAAMKPRSWAIIDVAPHPGKPHVLLQSLTSEDGVHALVYDGKILLLTGVPTFRPQDIQWEDPAGFCRGSAASNLVGRPYSRGIIEPEWSGPFTAPYVLDDQHLLVVARKSQGHRRSEVLVLLQRHEHGWHCWPLLGEGHDMAGVILRSIRCVWRAPDPLEDSALISGSCWIWGLCSTASEWQDRQLKLTWDLSVRPVQVEVELTNLHTGGLSVPAELESFSLKQLNRRGLFESCIQKNFQEPLLPAVGQSRAQQSSCDPLASIGRGDSESSHFRNISLRGHDTHHSNDLFTSG